MANKSKYNLFAAAVSLCVISHGAIAMDGKVADLKKENQEKRIEQGKDSGALNKREAKRLGRAHERTEQQIEDAKSDGVVTSEEARKIHREQKIQSKRIHRQKHDGQEANTGTDNNSTSPAQ